MQLFHCYLLRCVSYGHALFPRERGHLTVTNKHTQLQAFTTSFRPLPSWAKNDHRTHRPTHYCDQLRKVSCGLRILTICLCLCLCAPSCHCYQLRTDTKNNENLLGAFAWLSRVMTFWHVSTRNGAERTVLTLIERTVCSTLAPVTAGTSCFVRLRTVTKEYGLLTTVELSSDRATRREGTLRITTLDTGCYC